MKEHHPARVLVIVGAALVLLGATWSSGILYWHVRIKRAMAAMEADDRTQKQATGTNVYPVVRPFNCPGADARAIPYLLAAIDEASAKENQDFMITLMVSLKFVVGGADGFEESPGIFGASPKILLPDGTTLSAIRRTHEQNGEWWDRNRHHYPPWWMWWSGKRRSP